MEIKKETSIGGLIISEDVIAAIACNAAKDIEGVAGIATRPVDIKAVIKKANFTNRSSKSVKVTEEDNDLVISIYINLREGSKIPVVAEAVQSSIKDAVQNMTGRIVSKVNVTIAGIEFTDTTEPKETEQ